MSLILKDRVRETTLTTGTGAFALGGALPGYRTFASQMVNGDTAWYCCVLPGSAWETGIGTWVTGNSLQRTTVLDSSNGGAAVSFGAGTKDVFIALPATKGNMLNNSFPPGTILTFQQTNAPLYWTKQVTHNDKALRVVSGAASSGGANSFGTVFNSTFSVNNFTLTQLSMPSHSHSVTGGIFGSNGALSGTGTGYTSALNGATNISIASNGSDGAHAHTMNMKIQYVDLILCSKD